MGLDYAATGSNVKQDLSDYELIALRTLLYKRKKVYLEVALTTEFLCE